MPPLLAVAALEVGAWFGFISSTAAILGEISIGISAFQAAKARRQARDAYNASLKDRTVMTATVDRARSRCYGRIRSVDGVVFKATRGDKKQFYTLVIALCGHEIDGVEQVMFGDTILTLDSNGSVLTSPWYRGSSVTQQVTVPSGSNSVTLPSTPISGSVKAVAQLASGDQVVTPTVSGSTVTFSGTINSAIKQVVYQVDSNSIRAQVRVYNGGDGQDLSASLAADFPGMITPGAHKFAGMALLRVDLGYDQDAFPNGVPNPITAIFRGAKIYDPRTGLTAWSENPALIARDWSLYANGGGCQASDLVPEDFIAAANACDVAHAFTSVNGNGSSTTTTRPMYTCGIVCDTSANPLETLSAICESMAGDFAWPGGKLSVRAGAYTLPAGTITGDWLSDKGPIEMVKDAARADLINVITPTISNAANNYVAAPIPRVVADAYVTIDGEEYPQEVTYEGVTDSDHAAHIASVTLKDARAAKTYTLPCNLRGLNVKVGQNWTVNIPEIGLANEVMRCVGWKLDFEQSCCYLTMKSTSAAIFDPDATFKRDDALPNSSIPNPFSVPDVTGVSLQSGTSQLFIQSDGTILTRVLVSWNAAQDQAVLNGGSVEIRYGTFDKDPSTWQFVTVPGTETQAYLTGVEDDRVYGFSLRFRNKLVGGRWGSVIQHLVLGKSQPPAAVTGLAAAQVGSDLRITRTPSTEVDWAAGIYECSTNGGTSWFSIPDQGTQDRNGMVWTNAVTGALQIRARDIDTSGNIGAVSSAINVTVTPVTSGQLPTWLIASNGFSATGYQHQQGIWNDLTNTRLYAGGGMWNVAKVKRSDKTVTFIGTYDTLNGGATAASAMASALNAIGSDYIVAIWTLDEPSTNRLSGGLPDAMYRHGASPAVFGSMNFLSRGAYILVGIGGCGMGNGAESYAGFTGSDPNAWCEMAFQITPSGSLIVSGDSSGARSLFDYGYVGTDNMAANAATEVTQDYIDLTGAVTPAGSTAYTLREVTVTASKAGVLEFSASLDGAVNFDGGASFWWALSYNSGAEAIIGPFVPTGFTGTAYYGIGTCLRTFGASAGDTFQFRLKSSRFNPGPNPLPKVSTMRATLIKR